MENVLVTPSGHVCIADFGNAEVLDRKLTYQQFHDERIYGASGTDGYLPPERVNGDQGYNFKTDTWTYGSILLELLLINGGVSNSLEFRAVLVLELTRPSSTGTLYIILVMGHINSATTTRYQQVTMGNADWLS
jgi:serine/threonine protein kinase